MHAICLHYIILATEIWEEDEDELEVFQEEINPGSETGNMQTPIIVCWLLLFIYQLQIKHFIPDAAIDTLLKFLYTMFILFGTFSDKLKNMSGFMPRTIHSFRRNFGASHFKRLVVCSKCNLVRSTDKCIERSGVSKLCDSKEFSRSLRCNTVLLKTVELASRKRVL